MFTFQSTEQLEIQRSVGKLCRELLPPLQRAEISTFPRELLSSFAALGLTGLSISEQHGGSGAGALTSLLVMEEIASVDLGPAIVLSVHLMAAGLIERHGSAELKAHYLGRMAQGELLGAFALTEPSAGSDAAAIRTSAVRRGDHYELTGEKCYITSAGIADLYIVFAVTNPSAGKRGISAFIVERDTPGLTIGATERKMGCERSPIASLSFSTLKVPEHRRLGAEGAGYGIALSGLAGGRINIAACANGLSRAALEAAVAHLANRSQFGRPLIEFQGLQFMLADMKIRAEAAQLMTWQAAAALEGAIRSDELPILPSMAKCLATDAAMNITTDAVQLLGGAGYIRDYGVERLMRDAKMLQIVEGTNQIQRTIIAGSYLPK